MKRRLAVLLPALWLAAMPARAEVDFSSKKIPMPPLQPAAQILFLGEKLVFDVYWFGFRVGEGALEAREGGEKQGRKSVHIIATAKTNDFLSKIYPVEDVVESFIDAETHTSLEFRKSLKEARYRADEITVFDVARKKGYYESRLNGSKKEFDIQVPVHDLVSVFYWFRRQNIPPGKSARAYVSSEEKDHEVELKVLGHEWKELLDLGNVPALKVEPVTRIQGVLYRRGRVWVHFSSEAARVPFFVTFKTPFGPVVGVLNREKSRFPYETRLKKPE